MWTKIISPLGRSLRPIRLILPHVFSLLLLVPCLARSHDLPLETLRLPPGFQISVFAELANPRQLALSESGIVYAGSRRAGHLYGAPCNVCLKENPWFATIMSLDLEREPLQPEVFSRGVRNTVGFSWHPDTGELWFTDNGRDLLGDDTPSCELNRAPKAGLHFGFPYMHARSVIDPKFGAPAFPVEPPVVELGPHVAPLAMKFYTGTMLPARYRGEIFIAEHGSWNRTQKAGHTGYNITIVNPETGAKSILIDGWLQNNAAWGRPTDILEMPDGSLLIADDHADVIYRLSYEAP